MYKQCKREPSAQPYYVLMTYAEIAWVVHSNDNNVNRVISGSDAIY
jgi:hypothetical protein